MSKVHRIEQTTSSSFYDATIKKARNQFPICQPMKSSFPDLVLAIENMNDRTYLLQMEEQINQIRKFLRKIEQNIATISEVNDLKTLVQKMQQQLALARQKYLVQHAGVKEQIQRMLNNLQKLLQSYKKDWERLRKKCEVGLNEEIEEIRTQKFTNQISLTTLLKTKGTIMKQGMNQFSHQLKLSKKNRNQRTSKLFSHLQNVRNNLNLMVARQQAKRSDYDQIIYGLLDKTCQNAATALRRRVY